MKEEKGEGSGGWMGKSVFTPCKKTRRSVSSGTKKQRAPPFPKTRHG
jgi:hypothetical protein